MGVRKLACAGMIALGLPLAASAQTSPPNSAPPNSAPGAAPPNAGSSTGYSGVPAGVANGAIATTIGPDTTSGTPSGVAPAPASGTPAPAKP